jgi:uncharacterized protein (DUF488 family)
VGTPFFTIGHSNRSIDEFVGLLGEHRIEVLVDVRRLPGSERFPQFDRDPLASTLAEAGIGYRWAEGLAGRRRASEVVPRDVNGWWQNRSFHNYADHALSDEFRSAFADLRRTGREHPTAVMCAEAVWWRCHRRVIADWLIAGGDEVIHIMAPGRVEVARLTEGAVIRENHDVNYPAGK